MSKKNIGNYLMEMKFIKESDIAEGLEYQKKTGLRFGEALIELGKITRPQLEYVVSQQSGLPYVNLTFDQMDIDLINRFSLDFLKRYKAIPIYEDDEAISVVTDDPFDSAMIEYFEKNSGKRVNLSVGNIDNIEEILNRLNVKLRSALSEFINEIKFEIGKRYDFIIHKDKTEVNLFHNGMLESLSEINMGISEDELTLLLGKIGDFIYKTYRCRDAYFFTCYKIEPFDGVAFSDFKSIGSNTIFYSDMPVNGYKYITNRELSGLDIVKLD